jgi:hypothetical protein
MLQNTSQTLNSCGSMISGANEARKNPLNRSRGEAALFCACARIDSCRDSAKVS